MLERIKLDEFQDKIEWLWEKARTQSYAFDDTVKENTQAFLLALFATDSVHWYNESGMASLANIQPSINANVHFLLWNRKYDTMQLMLDAVQLFEEAFQEFSLNRITATIPAFNPLAQRLCLKLGMRYEGTMRGCFLHEGVYHDLLIYGLLRSEFEQIQMEALYGRNDESLNEAS